MRKHLFQFASLLSIALAVAFLAPQRAVADDDDPPGRVARLSYAHGAVSFNPAGTDDWVSAVVNRPVTTGDKLWTDNGGGAKIHLLMAMPAAKGLFQRAVCQSGVVRTRAGPALPDRAKATPPRPKLARWRARLSRGGCARAQWCRRRTCSPSA